MDIKKIYYSISEVCKIVGLEPHVLRYWESEFNQLRPKKNRAGNRAYKEKDIEIVKYIKYLLYEEKFTIPGAKRKLLETANYSVEKQTRQNIPVPERKLSFDDVKKELRDIYTLLIS